MRTGMESTNEELRELTLLEKIENDPDVNQSTLARQLGVAVGTVNWHLKRLIAKGYGESQPRASNETESGRRQNRRIEVALPQP